MIIIAALAESTSALNNEHDFQVVNDWARATPWLHGLMTWYAGTGAVLFAGLLIAGWWFARRGADPRRMAVALWAALAAVIAVGVNQPLVGVVREERPYVVLPHALLLVGTLGGFLFPLRPRHHGRRGCGRTAAALMAPRTARHPRSTADGLLPRLRGRTLAA